MKLGELSRDEAATALEWVADMLWEPPSVATLVCYTEAGPYLVVLARAGATNGNGEAVENALSTLDAMLADPGEDLRKTLAVDNTALFCGTRRDAPHPYESVFAGPGVGLAQGCAASARLAYEVAGFQWDGGKANEPADHVATELRYLACELRASERDPSRAAIATAFYEEHLTGWLDEFGRRVEGAAETEVYRAIGALVAPAARGGASLAR